MNTPTKGQLSSWLLQPLPPLTRSFIVEQHPGWWNTALESLHGNLTEFLQTQTNTPPFTGREILESWRHMNETLAEFNQQKEPVNVPTNTAVAVNNLEPWELAQKAYLGTQGSLEGAWRSAAQAAIQAHLAQVEGIPSEEECWNIFEREIFAPWSRTSRQALAIVRLKILACSDAQRAEDKKEFDGTLEAWGQQSASWRRSWEQTVEERDTLASELEEAEKKPRDQRTLEYIACNIQSAFVTSATAGGQGSGMLNDAAAAEAWGDIAASWLEGLMEQTPLPLPPTFHILLDPTRDTKQEGDEYWAELSDTWHVTQMGAHNEGFTPGRVYRRLVSQPYYLRANEMLKKQVEEQHGLYVESAGIANSEKLRANAAEQRAEKAEDSASEITSQRDVFKNKLIQIGYENNELRAQLAAKEKELGEEKDRSHKLSQEKGELFARCVAKDLELSTLRPVSLKDRRPTKKDANTQGLVQWHWSNGNVGLHHWDTNFPHSGPVAWCSIPKPPQPDTLRQEFEEWYRERFPGIRNAEHETTCWESYQAARAGKEKA